MPINETILDVSFVIPCLNEEKSIRQVIEEINNAYRLLPINYEIIVADNGSTDNSQLFASEFGARVIEVEEKGYGSALQSGFREAKGKFIVMGDADGSYHFEDSIKMLELLGQGYDFVLGNRFSGKIEKGAMPKLHKYIGNPLLSFLARFLFKIPVQDFHCGLRAFSRDKINSIKFYCTGMEFASELVIEARKNNLRISEVPITLYKDLRNAPSHLRSFPDGWRHLKYLLTQSPNWLFLAPGILILVFSIILLLLFLYNPLRNSMINFSYGTLIFSVTLGFVSLVYFWVFHIATILLREGPKDLQKRNPVHSKLTFIFSLTSVFVGLLSMTYLFILWGFNNFQNLKSDQVITFSLIGLFFISSGIISIGFNFLKEVVNYSKS
jgi:glycosyltransferase involved in cell wall biosynthesis